MKNTFCMAMVIVTCLAAVSFATLPSDNFNDNSMDTSLWTLVEWDPTNGWLDETNARLEMRATTAADDAAALYISNNWGFLTTSDFSLRLDFHNSSTAEASVFFGIAKDAENDVWFDAAYEGGEAWFCWDALVDDEEFDFGEKERTSSDGTFYISYDAGEDELYLSEVGYWSGNAWATIPDLLQDAWGGDPIGVLMGGDIWASGTAIDSGDAYLDNFVVDSGNVVPEPVTVVLLGLGTLALIKTKRK